MISGWVVRLIASLSLVGLLLFEAGSPLIARVQLDGVAGEAARQANREFDKSGSKTAAEKAAQAEAAKSSAQLTAFAVDKNSAAVTISRVAPSVIFGKWDKTKGYYNVTVNGVSKGGL